MKQRFALRTYFYALIVEGIISVLVLMLIPGETESAWLLGYSKNRWLLAAFPLLLLSVTGWLVYQARNNKTWYPAYEQKTREFFAQDSTLTLGIYLPLTLALAGVYFLFTTATTTDLHLKGYLTRLAPLIAWLTAINLQTVWYLASLDPSRWRGYWRRNGIALGLLTFILAAGLGVHLYLGNPDRPAPAVYAAADQVEFNIKKQDIYLVYLEGMRMLAGENPYARATSIEELHWNDRLPTYLPLIYYGSWLTHRAGVQALDQWVNLWRGIFLGFNLAIAFLIFHLGHHRFNSTPLATFGALFWLFNRWTLYITTVYHFNFIAIFFFVLALALHSRFRNVACLLFGLSLGVKHNAIFLIPVFLIWAWQESNENRWRNLLRTGVLIGLIPLLASLPFMVLNLEGFVKSLLISLTRYPETHIGVLSLDALMGWVGLPAKTPLLVMMALIYLIAWKRKIPPFAAGLLVMLVFVDFHSVLFRHYMVWVIPLFPLVTGEALAWRSTPAGSP